MASKSAFDSDFSKPAPVQKAFAPALPVPVPPTSSSSSSSTEAPKPMLTTMKTTVNILKELSTRRLRKKKTYKLILQNWARECEINIELFPEYMNNYITLFSADPKGEPESRTTVVNAIGGRMEVEHISNQENLQSERARAARMPLADRRVLELFRCDCCNFTSDYFSRCDVDGLTVNDCYGSNIAINNVRNSIELINCEDIRIIIYGKVACIVMDGCVNIRIRFHKSWFQKQQDAIDAKVKKQIKKTKAKKAKSSKKAKMSPEIDSEIDSEINSDLNPEKEEKVTIPTILANSSEQFRVEIEDDEYEDEDEDKDENEEDELVEGNKIDSETATNDNKNEKNDTKKKRKKIWIAKLIVRETKGSQTKYQCTDIDVSNLQLFVKTTNNSDPNQEGDLGFDETIKEEPSQK